MYREDILLAVEELTGNANTVSIPFAFIDAAETVDRALFLTQTLFWSSVSYRNGRDGWFYKSYKDWKSDVGLGEYEVRRAAKWFKEQGIVDIALRKAAGAPTLHYRINRAKFSKWIHEKLLNRYPKNSGIDSKGTQGSLTETPAEISTDKRERRPRHLNKTESTGSLNKTLCPVNTLSPSMRHWTEANGFSSEMADTATGVWYYRRRAKSVRHTEAEWLNDWQAFMIAYRNTEKKSVGNHGTDARHMNMGQKEDNL